MYIWDSGNCVNWSEHQRKLIKKKAVYLDNVIALMFVPHKT